MFDARMVHYLSSSWELITNLDFEYSVITRKRKFSWTFLVSLSDHRIGRPTEHLQLYLGCRWCPLFAITTQFLGSDLHYKMDCHVCTSLAFVLIKRDVELLSRLGRSQFS